MFGQNIVTDINLIKQIKNNNMKGKHLELIGMGFCFRKVIQIIWFKNS